MQTNLPAKIDRNTYALDPQTTVNTAPAECIPNMDGYSTVCVQVRESQLIATNQPIAINYNHGQIPPYVTQVPPYNTQSYGGQNVPPAMSAPRKGAKRANVIGWICVSQLAVIIGLIAFQNSHLDYKSSIVRMADSAMLSGDALRILFNNSVAAPLGLSSSIPTDAAAGHKVATKSKGKAATKAATKTASHGKAHAVRLANGFIPPPPPDYAMPKSSLMVPPPPVAYSLNGAGASAGAGAVAASTLPPLSSIAVAQASKKSAPKAAAESAPANHAPAPKEKPEGTVAATSAAPVEDPGPEWFGTMPNAPFADKEAFVPPPLQEFKATPHAAPAYAWSTPTQVSTPAPTHRTVMSGKRQRTIADR